MEQADVDRLEKIEIRAKELYKELFGLEVPEIYFDLVPSGKMLEILAYGFPTGLSHWTSGRNYERLRTIHDKVSATLPMEVVLHADPYRAYLSSENTLAVQALVITHVMAHCLMFEHNKWFKNTRRDLNQIITQANIRFNEYERIYGIDELEMVMDAGKALQYHSNPYDIETEEEKKKRVYEANKLQLRSANKSQFADITAHDGIDVPTSAEAYTETPQKVHQFNHELWRTIQRKTPVEPTEDILRFIIDNSKYLEDWQKDVLEVLRMEGQYYYPMARTKYTHEGFSTWCHEKIMGQLFKEGLLTDMEHGQYNYINSLVKAEDKMSLNPYLIGSEILRSVEERWNKGRHGTEYENCTDFDKKASWDDHSNKGIEKVKEIMTIYTDWMLIQEFLTPELIDKLDLYIYIKVEEYIHIDYVRTEHTAEQIRQIVIQSFASSMVPRIEVVNGSYGGQELLLEHRYSGIPLNKEYAEKTLQHIARLWNNTVNLRTRTIDGKIIRLTVEFGKDGLPATKMEITAGTLD